MHHNMKGRIALTASNLRLEHTGQPPFLKGVSIKLKEEPGSGVIWVYIRHDPLSRYSFHQKANSNEWNVALPRSDFIHISRNWGNTVFRADWDMSVNKGYMSFSLPVESLAPVRGGGKALQRTTTDTSIALSCRDKLNKLVTKGIVCLRLEDGKVVVDFKP